MSKEVSFEIKTDLRPAREFAIEANFGEVKNWLVENLEPYRTMAVTEDTIQACKGYRANIRKVKENIESCRKAAKKAVLEGYEPFEAKCKELTALCDDAANGLDTQLKAFDEARREEKQATLQEYFANVAKELIDMKVLDYFDVADPKWLNATVSLERAMAEIDEKVEAAREDIKTIRSLNSEFEVSLLDYYGTYHDLGATIRKNQTLTAMNEYTRQMEAQKAQEQPPVIPNHYPEKGVVEKAPIEDATESLYQIDFRVWVTAPQRDMLKNFLVKANIKYGKVPK